MLSKVLFLIVLFYNMYSFFPSVLCWFTHIKYNMQTLCRRNYLEDKHSTFENCFSSANIPRYTRRRSLEALFYLLIHKGKLADSQGKALSQEL